MMQSKFQSGTRETRNESLDESDVIGIYLKNKLGDELEDELNQLGEEKLMEYLESNYLNIMDLLPVSTSTVDSSFSWISSQPIEKKIDSIHTTKLDLNHETNKICSNDVDDVDYIHHIQKKQMDMNDNIQSNSSLQIKSNENLELKNATQDQILVELENHFDDLTSYDPLSITTQSYEEFLQGFSFLTMDDVNMFGTYALEEKKNLAQKSDAMQRNETNTSFNLERTFTNIKEAIHDDAIGLHHMQFNLGKTSEITPSKSTTGIKDLEMDIPMTFGGNDVTFSSLHLTNLLNLLSKDIQANIPPYLTSNKWADDNFSEKDEIFNENPITTNLVKNLFDINERDQDINRGNEVLSPNSTFHDEEIHLEGLQTIETGGDFLADRSFAPLGDNFMDGDEEAMEMKVKIEVNCGSAKNKDDKVFENELIHYDSIERF